MSTSSIARGGSSRGGIGGAANEAGAEYRAGVAAWIVAHLLRELPLPGLGLPDQDALPISVLLEGDRAVDDIEVRTLNGVLLLQAKRQIGLTQRENGMLSVVSQWRRAAKDMDPRTDRLIIATGRPTEEIRRLGEALATNRRSIAARLTGPRKEAFEKLRAMLADLKPEMREAVLSMAVVLHLEKLADFGINAVELLPVADSADTVNWGYGSRFFLAPDIDIGTPTDLRYLVKRCHQLGIRVILDIVMYFSKSCPLEQLGGTTYYLTDQESGGEPYGGPVFRYWSDPAPDPSFPAREFQFRVAEWWVSEYHIDGFRVDAFADINNWEFVQTFTSRAWGRHKELFPSRPFYVVAEDSWCRPQAARDDQSNPGGKRVVDGIWNFAYYRDARRFLLNEVETRWGEPSRTDRLTAMISLIGCWDELQRSMHSGFAADDQAVNYITSHDVQTLPRLMTDLLINVLADSGLLDGLRQRLYGMADWEIARFVVDQGDAEAPLAAARDAALERVAGAFALLLTSCGIPMFLAGEEFGDVHDLDPGDWHVKMSDPVDWNRAARLPHAALTDRVGQLIALRRSAAALRSGTPELFYRHPAFDENLGPRVFGYAQPESTDDPSAM